MQLSSSFLGIVSIIPRLLGHDFDPLSAFFSSSTASINADIHCGFSCIRIMFSAWLVSPA